MSALASTSALYLSTLPPQPDLPKLEEAVLEYWQQTQVFEKSVTSRPTDKAYVFYDGPPFATGMPHYGHLLGSTSKDLIPRYWTMKGYRVERVWGWDCHGLPIEHMIEKQLNIKNGKRGIEELGIDKFNAACRSEVLRLDTEWEKIITRLGRWVDFKNNYKTMDTTYMESVWWAFQQLYEKGLIYQGKKVILYCPRCATPLSNFEIAMDNSYEMVTDPSVTIKFLLEDKPNEYFLAWTTTPWTLPGNVGLAVQPEATYVKVAYDNAFYWVAADRVKAVFQDKKWEKVTEASGQELVGTKYQPLYPYVASAQTPNAWTVLSGSFVSLEDGTGIVHTAAVFGEDDYALAVAHSLPLVATLDEEGKFLPFVEIAAGIFYKKADEVIQADLKSRGLLFHATTLEHSYPFCYRCGTPLYYNAVPAWFVDIQTLKPQLLAQNQHLNWYPAHLKEGRFGKGLTTAPDWNISRSRYWGTPMPIWEEYPAPISQEPRRRVIGSIAELQQWAVDPTAASQVTDIHRERIDQIEVWIDDAKTVKGKRIREVFDCWVESGSMPFASRHYPFENQADFEANYPAQFVSEYIAQTRAWFYTLHVMSVGLFGKHAVENVLTTGTIMAADGSKMSKSKKNFPDPMKVIDSFGVDSLRLYMMSSSVMNAENSNFNEKEVGDIRKRVFLIWWNVLVFFRLYAGEQTIPDQVPHSNAIMDRWILSRLQSLVLEMTQEMDAYDVVKSSRALMNFVTDLSTWYIRQSRDRFRHSDTKREAVATLGFVLKTIAQLAAPFTPFFAELSYQNLSSQACDSVHLTDWPQVNQESIQPELAVHMELVRKAAEKAHAVRKQEGLKVRQPLARLHVTQAPSTPNQELLEILAQELNVKQVKWEEGKGELSAELDTSLTAELLAEGEARELIRSIQNLRKAARLQASQHTKVSVPEWPKGWQKHIEQVTNTTLQLGKSLRLV